MNLREIGRELKAHAPFTALGAVSGILIVLAIAVFKVPPVFSEKLFWIFHPLHVLLSALVTTAMFRLHSKAGLLWTICIGYVGSVGIATLSDSIIPFAGELLLQLPHAEAHIGFVEKWWLIHPVAFLGIAAGYLWPRTHVPHFGHVFLSTWASVFHITMAMGAQFNWLVVPVIALFLFLSVWIPCCTSDIVFPLLFANNKKAVPD